MLDPEIRQCDSDNTLTRIVFNSQFTRCFLLTQVLYYLTIEMLPNQGQDKDIYLFVYIFF